MSIITYYIDELHPMPSAQACSSCFIPDPTSLRSVRSLYFKLNANSQTQPHFVQSLYFQLNAKSQTQPHFIQLVRSLYFKLNAKSQTQPHFIWLGLCPCILNSMLSPRPVTTRSPKPRTSSIKPPNPQKDPQRSAELPPMPTPTSANSDTSPANSDGPLANFGACPAATDTYPGLPKPREPPPLFLIFAHPSLT
ncbi:hypothetical protein E4T56_gene11852 [Termitomyces sp. T112]|nr:hypothetical protein E4T56_gene11852 [Termitomyces sp. T112]